MMRRIACSLLMLTLFVSLVGAEDPRSPISMFGSWVNEDKYGEESEFGNLEPLVMWSVFDLQRNKRTRVVGTFAVEDEDKVVRLNDFRVHRIPKRWWLEPWLEELVAGYFIPPMGREWSSLNPFQINTVRYSGISDSLVARDAGLQVKLAPVYACTTTVAGFLDNRKHGYKDEIGNTHRHFYFRICRPFLYRVVVGGSYRWSTLDNKPWMLELTRESEKSLYAFEFLRVERISQWYVLAEYDIRHRTLEQGGRVRAVARFEDLRYGERLVFGCGFFPFEALTVKTNLVSEWFNGSVTQKLLLQGIIHFSP